MQGEGQGEPPPVLSSASSLTAAYHPQPQQGHTRRQADWCGNPVSPRAQRETPRRSLPAQLRASSFRVSAVSPVRHNAVHA